MAFDPKECAIPVAYCGNGAIPRRKLTDDVVYTGRGTRVQCLQKGIGVGSAIERTKNLPGNSLQHIKYVGPVYEQNIKAQGIRNTNHLMNEIRRDVNGTMAKIKVGVTKAGKVDYKAYNSILLFIHRAGGTGLPKCKKLY